MRLKKIFLIVLVGLFFVQQLGFAQPSALPLIKRLALASSEREGEITAVLSTQARDFGLVADDLQVQALIVGLKGEVEGAMQKPSLPSATSSFTIDETILGVVLARRAYFQFDFRGCLAFLEQEADKVGDFVAAHYHRALLGGICHLALEESTNARKAFSEAVRLRPQETLNTELYSPRVRQVYEEAREAFRRQAKRVSVALSSTPAFANVEWNGVFVGQTPLVLEGIYEGRHYLHLETADGKAWSGEVSCTAPSPCQLRVTLEQRNTGQGSALYLKPATQRGEPGWFRFLRQAGESLAVTEFLWVRSASDTASGRYQIERIAPAEGKILGSAELSLQPQSPTWEQESRVIAALKDLFPQAALLAQSVPKTPSPQEPREEVAGSPALEGAHVERPGSLENPLASPVRSDDEPGLSKRWYENKWFWVIAGVLLAGAAAGTAVALSQGGHSGGVGGSGSGTDGVVVGFTP